MPDPAKVTEPEQHLAGGDADEYVSSLDGHLGRADDLQLIACAEFDEKRHRIFAGLGLVDDDLEAVTWLRTTEP